MDMGMESELLTPGMQHGERWIAARQKEVLLTRPQGVKGLRRMRRVPGRSAQRSRLAPSLLSPSAARLTRIWKARQETTQ